MNIEEAFKALPSASDLMGLAVKHKKVYQNGKSFPHMYFDDFLSEELLLKVLDEFPRADGFQNWRQFQNALE